MKKADFLRKRYPRFFYQNYFWKLSKNNLEIFFDFFTEPDIHFRPKVIIEKIDRKQLSRIGKRVLNPVRNRKLLNGVNNLVFHLGLIEMLSYWKAACSPEIEIKAGFLTKEQINWWKDLIRKGMGQFFFENKINFRKPNFLRIKTLPFQKKPKLLTKSATTCFRRKGGETLVPISGGKDSVVTLETFKEAKKDISCFSLNPTPAAKKIMKIAGCKKPIVVRRKIDEKLLELNRKGALNGHTPFSAYLAFLSVLVAAIFGKKYIAFSNERSSNEGNLRYLGKMINHQYSKSSEFERKFKQYCRKYLAKNINYFSLLRPYTELEISKIFLKYPQYFSVFSSCNVSQKTGKRWCGNCAKCLFVYATLYPFLEKKELLEIFGRDIFGNQKLLPIMKSLIERGKAKPFECVGTKKESRLAFSLCLKKAKKTGKIPFLLRKL